MKRITSILSASSLAVLLLLTSSAHAQSGRIAANIPFAFTVGGISLPAGRYEFANTGDRIVQVQNAERHTVLTLSVASIERRGLPKKSMLKFDTVGDRHILVPRFIGQKQRECCAGPAASGGASNLHAAVELLHYP